MQARAAGTDKAQRLFFALVPDAPTCRALGALVAEAAHATGGRAPRPENLHITVAFLGDVPPTRVPAVLALGARAAAGADAFALTLDRLGMFREAGIAWVAPTLIPPPLQRLFEGLRDGLAAEGLREERRAFHPHVTLARRCRRPLSGLAPPAIAWPVEALVLMASVTRSEGPDYAEMATWRLGDDAAGAATR